MTNSIKTFKQFLNEDYHFKVKHSSVYHGIVYEYVDTDEEDDELSSDVLAIGKALNINARLFVKDDDHWKLEDVDKVIENNESIKNKEKLDCNEFFAFRNDEAEKYAFSQFKQDVDIDPFNVFSFDTLKKCLEPKAVDYFKTCVEEMLHANAEDLYASGDDEFENGLVNYLYYKDEIKDGDFEEDEDGNPDYTKCKWSEDDLYVAYEEYFTNEFVDDNDYVQYYIDNLGENELRDVMKKKGFEFDAAELWNDWTDNHNEYDWWDIHFGEEDLRNEMYIVYCIE